MEPKSANVVGRICLVILLTFNFHQCFAATPATESAQPPLPKLEGVEWKLFQSYTGQASVDSINIYSLKILFIENRLKAIDICQTTFKSYKLSSKTIQIENSVEKPYSNFCSGFSHKGYLQQSGIFMNLLEDVQTFKIEAGLLHLQMPNKAYMVFWADESPKADLSDTLTVMPDKFGPFVSVPSTEFITSQDRLNSIASSVHANPEAVSLIDFSSSYVLGIDLGYTRTTSTTSRPESIYNIGDTRMIQFEIVSAGENCWATAQMGSHKYYFRSPISDIDNVSVFLDINKPKDCSP